jgi:hypothetical protein
VSFWIDRAGGWSHFSAVDGYFAAFRRCDQLLIQTRDNSVRLMTLHRFVGGFSAESGTNQLNDDQV